MNQPARIQGKDIQSFGNMLRSRIDSSLAVDKLNAAINGEPITLVQFNSIRLAIDKCLPSLAAMVLQIQDDRPESIHDINARLLASGLSDHIFPDSPALEHAQENAIVSEKVVEAGTPAIEDE